MNSPSSMVLMQPKIYNLRLNLEQLQHTVDGWIENRKLISEEYIPLYDAQLQDVVDQFKSQGVDIHFDINESETDNEDLQKAKELLMEIKLLAAVMNPEDFKPWRFKVKELEDLLFGDQHGE